MAKARAVHASDGRLVCEDLRIPHLWIGDTDGTNMESFHYVCDICGARGELPTYTPQLADAR